MPVACFEWRRPRQWQEQCARSALATSYGALAQLGERLICIQEVRSSILLGSTKVELRLQFVKNGSVAQVVRAHA